MREIKFRGYAVDELVGSQWVYGTGVHRTIFAEEFAKECGQTGESFIFTDSGWLCVHDESIGESTYNTDYDDDEIFEGDYFIDEHGSIGVVKFIEDGFKIVWYTQGNDKPFFEDYLSYHALDRLKIDGNLYENNKWNIQL